MSLKDASAFNVQFRGARPVFIDTLSFAPYEEGRPWIAYGQYCRHFLAPLTLMHYVDVRLAQLLRIHIDGVPLPLASRALPWRSKLRPGLAIHLHTQARLESRRLESDGKDSEQKASTAQVSRQGLMGILDSLRGTISKLGTSGQRTVWDDYYSHTNYSEAAAGSKAALVRDFLGQAKPARVWDLGANTGVYSALAAELGAECVAFDVDHGAVDALYAREQAEPRGLLPLVIDLANPSPSLGWAHGERDSLAARGPVDCVMALALIHHLCIGNNVPLPSVASFLAELCRYLVIEFVPKEDSMVDGMLAVREDVFPDYTEDDFRTAFGAHFAVVAEAPVAESCRRLFLMERRAG